MNSDYNHHMRQLDERRKEQVEMVGRSYDFTHKSEVVKPLAPIPEKPKWVAEFDRKTAHWDKRLRAAAFEAEFNRRDKENNK